MVSFPHRALLAPVVLLGACGAAPRDARPNVLLVTIDGLRPDQLAAQDGAGVETPALDALLAEALVFEQAFTVAPITTASLGALLTARMPRNHGALNDGYDLAGTEPTLITVLDGAGYRTAAFLPDFLAGQPGFVRGLDLSAASGPDPAGDLLVERALDFIRGAEADGEPWFVWVHLLETRSPYAPGPELEAQRVPAGAAVEERLRQETCGERDHLAPEAVQVMQALYQGEVERADRSLAPLLERVRGDGANTVTVLTAAHGEHFYEALNYVGHDAWLFESMLRVPLAFHRSGGALAGARRDPVTQLDVAPTLLALLGLPWPSRDGGQDLIAAPAAADRILVHETFAPQSFRDKIALRQGAWKFQEARGQNWMQDETQADFRRITNLADDPREISAVPARPEAGPAFVRLRTLFDEWAGTQADPAKSRNPALDERTRSKLQAQADLQSPHPQGDEADSDG